MTSLWTKEIFQRTGYHTGSKALLCIQSLRPFYHFYTHTLDIICKLNLKMEFSEDSNDVCNYFYATTVENCLKDVIYLKQSGACYLSCILIEVFGVQKKIAFLSKLNGLIYHKYSCKGND